MRVRRAQARLCGRDARAPKAPPVKPLMGDSRRARTASPTIWIPAFAGMTEREGWNDGRERGYENSQKPIFGKRRTQPPVAPTPLSSLSNYGALLTPIRLAL